MRGRWRLGGRWRLRRPWIAAAAAVALACLPALGWFVINRDATRAALRDRVEATLRARIPGARVGPSLTVDARFRLVFGPVTVPAVRRGAPAVVTVKQVRVRPRWRALLAGRAEAASVVLAGVTVETGRRGEALRDLADSLSARGSGTGARGGSEAEPPVLRFSDLRVRGPTVGGAVLEAGPFSGDARVRGDGSDRKVAFHLGLPGRGVVEGDLRRAEDGLALAARIQHVGRDVLPEALLRRLPVELVEGALSGDIDAPHIGRDGATVGWDLRADALTVSSPRLAAEPLGPLSAVTRGRATVDLASGRAVVESAEVRLGGDARAAATFSLELRLKPRATFDLRVDAPALDWRTLTQLLPAQLAPGQVAPRIAGPFGVALHVAGPVRDAAHWALDASVDLSSLGREEERTPLHGSFQHEAQLSGGQSRRIVVGPGNPAFVAASTLPQHVIRAITTSEDAGFWGHDGFDFHELEDAITSGARRGQLGRGASTISQQVAKNLWLGRERTLARKVREALLTIALEASLPKQRILEIYLNVAEWGPGIVGLGEAARHYFGKDARDLSPREAAFLATIIPNPVRFHVYCARGELSPAWDARVAELLYRLWSNGVLSTDQLDEALAERLAFTHS